MKKTYVSPSIVDHGSIANCTFTLSGLTQQQKRDGTVPRNADGTWDCMFVGNIDKDAIDRGKNWQALACDKFGEYSHLTTTVGS